MHSPISTRLFPQIMASISKTAAGYRVQLYVKGVRDSGTFRTRREADAWAARRTTELQAEAKKSPGQKTTLKQLLARYRDEVTPDKRGRRWEEIRLNRFCREKEKPALPLALPCTEITPEHIGEWRDARRNQVQASTILRELSLLSAVFTHARLEWRLVDSNPVTNVRKPAQKDHRTVTIKAWQVRRMLKQMGYRWGRRPATVGQAVAYVFLFALRTGMRAGEICNLTWDRVYADYCETPHKGGATVQSVRTVPLEARTLRLLRCMRGWDDNLVFGVSAASLDALFRKYRKIAGLDGFTFHDSRHTAATWMAKRVDVLTLCKIFGWKRLDQALTYYNPTASDIAQTLTTDRRPTPGQLPKSEPGRRR